MDLYDGVHPSQFLSSKWYCALCQSIVNDINDFSNELAMEEDKENGDDIDDSWDLKRRCVFTSKHIWECENCLSSENNTGNYLQSFFLNRISNYVVLK